MTDYSGYIAQDENIFNSCQFSDDLQNLNFSNSPIANTTSNNNALPSMPYPNSIQNISFPNENIFCNNNHNINNININNIDNNNKNNNNNNSNDNNNNENNNSHINNFNNNISNRNSNNNSNNTYASDNIPFVRIHAFESRSNSLNNQRSQNDIKAEPIKSEMNDAQSNSQITQPTQTPPSSGSTTPAIAAEITKALTTISFPAENESNFSQQEQTIQKPSPPLLLKCPQCLFLCISQTNLDIHISSTHDENVFQNVPNKIKCPGCDNIFISKQSLKIHLKFDHLMLLYDLEKILEHIPVEVPLINCKKKSRIYLKNVDCLREKSFQNHVDDENDAHNVNNLLSKESNMSGDCGFIDLINEENLISSNNNSITTDTQSNKPKQKITIKSVETLREPIYQHSLYNNEVHTTETFNLSSTQVYYNMDTGFATPSAQQNIDSNNEFIIQNHFEEFQQNQIAKLAPIEKQKRPPKIYIKNVDILKEPIYLPSTHISNILHVNETLPFNNIFTPPPPPVIPVVHQRLPIAPNSMQTSHLNIQNSNCSYASKNQSFPIQNTTQISASFSNSSTFSFSNQEQSGNNQTKSKIYIKNVDILKEPQFTECTEKKSTNFIHLRTVDELNLLDKTELNIMNNLNQNPNDKQQLTNVNNPSSENSENSDLDNSINRYDTLSPVYNKNLVTNFQCSNSNHQIAPIQLQINWENQDYNNGGFESLDNFIDTTSNATRNHQSQQYYDLNTPQRCDGPFDEDIVQTPNNNIDNDITNENDNDLFVCSDQLIPYRETSNSSFNAEQISIDLDSNLMIDTEINDESENDDIDLANNEIEIANKIVLDKFSFTINKTENKIPDNTLSSSETEKTAGKESSSQIVKPNEKGRIYVSENLMEDRSKNNNSIATELRENELKKHKGRPFGAKTQKRKKGLESSDSKSLAENRCDRPECGYKFKEIKTLEYHKLCHSDDRNQIMQCPECKSTEFTSWNTLHTHLWRSHSIDMDLYSCDQCKFKTPILSRLLNTHSKIHSNERNFKCEVCEKAFKNSRQLKNHRRIHRKYPNEEIELFKCVDCNAIFANKKTLKHHICPNNKLIVEEAKCSICGKICSSKSYLKIHMAIHDTNSKYICDCGEFSTNNPSSFRKHKAKHSKENKTYQCQYCDYQSIQASLYKKHLFGKHPEFASNIIHQCSHCKFSTIRKLQFYVHLAKIHNVGISNNEKNTENATITEKISSSPNDSSGSDKLNDEDCLNESCDQKVDVDFKIDQIIIPNLNFVV